MRSRPQNGARLGRETQCERERECTVEGKRTTGTHDEAASDTLAQVFCDGRMTAIELKCRTWDKIGINSASLDWTFF